MKSIVEILKERILVLDGAMGTMLQAYQFSEEDFRGSAIQRLAIVCKREQRHALHHTTRCDQSCS